MLAGHSNMASTLPCMASCMSAASAGAFVDGCLLDMAMVVAVPQSPKFRELASRWRDAPLVQGSGIQIVLVGRDGSVEGLKLR